MEHQAPERPTGLRKGNLASNLFALAAVIFAILAVVLYLQGSRTGGIAPIPTPAAGAIQIVNVTQALQAQGLDVQQPPGLFIPAGEIATPGQGIEIDGVPAFVFLFKDSAARDALAGIDPGRIIPERLAATPALGGEPHLVQGNDIAILVVGGDEAIWKKVEAALASLP